MAQVVKHQPRKSKALSSNAITTNQPTNKQTNNTHTIKHDWNSALLTCWRPLPFQSCASHVHNKCKSSSWGTAEGWEHSDGDAMTRQLKFTQKFWGFLQGGQYHPQAKDDRRIDCLWGCVRPPLSRLVAAVSPHTYTSLEDPSLKVLDQNLWLFPKSS
jgi:hypothetical protein